MHTKVNFSGIALLLALLVLGGGGCASTSSSSSSTESSSAAAPAGAPAGAVKVEQAPITPYMRSQVGTPNELSPLAPAKARNVRKVGDKWLCDLNGQTMVFDSPSSCWAPHQK